MSPPVRPTEQDVERVVATHGPLLYRVCLVALRHPQDAEDVVQETFCRYVERDGAFADADYEKAWLITVASNLCRNLRRFHFRHDPLNLDDVDASSEDAEPDDTRAALRVLAPRYHSVIHLHYLEGYSAKEIARLLRITPAAVLKRLERGRRLLKLEWGGPT
jgi:RNA polymerase sigma factor (sigma-70 family)